MARFRGFGTAAAIFATAWFASPSVVPAQSLGTRLDTDLAGAGQNSSSRPQVGLDASTGVVHAVWQDYRNAEWAIYHRSGTNLGGTWALPDFRLSPSGADAVDPRVAVDGSNVYVSWRRQSPPGTTGAERICVIASTNGGTSWGAVKILATGQTCVGTPEIAANPGNRAYAVWTAESIAGADQLFFAATANGGVTWSTPLPLSGGSTTRSALAHVVAGGINVGLNRQYVYVAYVELDTTTSFANVVFRGSINDGATFPANRTETLASYNTLAPAAALDLDLAANTGGTILATWVENAAVGIVVMGQRNKSFGLDGNWLGGATPLAIRVDDPTVTSRTNAYEPDGLVDSGGNCHAAFTGNVASYVKPGFTLARVFTRMMPTAANTWNAENNLLPGGSLVGTNSLPKLVPALAAVARTGQPDAVAVVFSFEHPGSLDYSISPFPTAIYPDIWVAHTKNLGASWATAQIGSAPSPAAAKQGFPSAVMRMSGATIEAGIVWDDRIHWTAPGGGGATGWGAPEPHFRKVVLP